MILNNFNKVYCSNRPTFCVLREALRQIHINGNVCDKFKTNGNCNNNLKSIIEQYDEKLLYNSTIESKRLKLGYSRNKIFILKKSRYDDKIKNSMECIEPLPISLKYFSENLPEVKKNVEINENLNPSTLTHFPFESSDSVTIHNINNKAEKSETNHLNADQEVRKRYQLSSNIKEWMTHYDNYEHDLVTSEVEEDTDQSGWEVNYGTPDPNSKISNVPCGGCGALLHCKDTAIPGYLPSEIFQNSWKKGAAHLSALICQRCYFLKEYNLALQVRVSSDDYTRVLTTIHGKKALVVLMVDLLDFPCSIWPGISEILGPKTPIMVVGNKVDLLPKDCNKFLTHIKKTLLENIKLSGFATANIKDVVLISAKTGFGVEELITSLQSNWKYQGDVYLVGCTNVGKSSLFNALLQSDYCKIQAADLVQRATTSLWPGTTLNLLKFPIMRPAGYRIILRHQRLQYQKRLETQERKNRAEKLKIHNSPKYATLIGHIGRSYNKNVQDDETKDSFSVQGNSNASGRITMGIRENDPNYALSRWCFDTPGVVQPDQILHLLTTEELVNTLPKELIRPETFCIKKGTSLFIAGLARLDYLDGPGSIRLTVFRSNELPITICHLNEADDLYKELLGTELLKIPLNSGDRLLKWPGLKAAREFTLTGTDWNYSCSDVVLSSAGWVAVNCAPEEEHKFRAWTPEKRGVYIRDCLLPKAVMLRGARIRSSVAYKLHKFI